MKLIKTKIDGPKIIKSQIFKDNRGYLKETFRNTFFKRMTFSFDLMSFSRKNVLRGLHIQTISSQSKIITVTQGKIFDVAVDLRKKSKNFGKVYSYILSASNKESLFIPKGFAHGYLVLEKNTVVIYNVDEYFYPKLQKTIAWNDEFLSIKWPKSKNLIISKKDKDGEKFQVNSPYFK